MKIEITPDTDVLKMQNDHPMALTLVGLFFSMISIIIFIVGGHAMMSQDGSMILLLIQAALFITIGLLLALGRSGVIIDKRNMMITKWYGILAPILKFHKPIADFNRVLLTKEARRSGKSTITVYPVSVESGADKLVEIAAPTDFNSARQLSENIAKYLRLDIADSSSGEEIIRELDFLDESLRDRVKRLNEIIETPEMPPNMRAVVEEQYGILSIRIPPMGFGCLHYVMLTPALFFGVFIFAFMGYPALKEGTDFVPLIMTGIFFLIPLAILLNFALSSARRQYRIEVSRATLKVEQINLFGKSSHEIPVDELESLVISASRIPLEAIEEFAEGKTDTFSSLTQNENITAEQQIEMQKIMIPNSKFKGLMNMLIRILPGPGIIATSDKLSINFGRSLLPSEIKYLHALIKKTIVGA